MYDDHSMTMGHVDGIKREEGCMARGLLSLLVGKITSKIQPNQLPLRDLRTKRHQAIPRHENVTKAIRVSCVL